MLFVEFLIYLLKAHSKTLVLISQLLGEEQWLKILNSLPQQNKIEQKPILKLLQANQENKQNNVPSPYKLLQEAVSNTQLSKELEIHLWSYPHYRAFIESSLDLGSPILTQKENTELVLIEEALSQAENWVHLLPVEEHLKLHIIQNSQPHWLRFRSEILNKTGKKLFTSVKTEL